MYPEDETIRVPKDSIPEGSYLVEAYVTDKEVVVLGEPDWQDDHNCDAMGCATLSHVVYRELHALTPQLKTSDEWAALFPNLTVLDPDGWDRSPDGWQFSWYEQRITEETFKQRIIPSTVQVVGGFDHIFDKEPFAESNTNATGGE